MLARRCASDAEEQSALYNMACAYAALGKRDSALTCLEVCAKLWQRLGLPVLWQVQVRTMVVAAARGHI